MRINISCFELDLPDEWEKIKEDQFQTKDECKGIYLNYYRYDDLINDEEILKLLISEQEIKVNQIEESNFRTRKKKITIISTLKYGIVDQYDKSRLFRIISVFYVNNGNILKISFHDYNCKIYFLSKKYFEKILKTLKLDEDFCWEYGIKSDLTRLEKVHVIKNDLFVDVNLYIDTFNEVEGRTILTTKNQWNNKEVGVQIIFENQWTKHRIENSEQIYYEGKVAIKGLISITENLINLLSDIYKVGNIDYRKTDIEATIVCFGINPEEMKNKKVFTKLIINENNEDLYTELYLNIDLRNKVLELREKDIGYRNLLLINLSQ